MQDLSSHGTQVPGIPAPGMIAQHAYHQADVPEASRQSNTGVFAQGEVTHAPCHCGPTFDVKPQYNTFAEDEASGRFPVQTTSTGTYPGPGMLYGIEMLGEGGDTDDTWQYTDANKIKMGR